ncbi:hypothetical protein SIIN_7481_T [Serendipita indica DSM 11827]|nr:hypothetical protein SIIN_7481_T [Serendipita indica DSM 11827]
MPQGIPSPLLRLRPEGGPARLRCKSRPETVRSRLHTKKNRMALSTRDRHDLDARSASVVDSRVLNIQQEEVEVPGSF